MRIVSRYLISEIASSSTMMIVVLWLVFFSQQIIRFLHSEVFGALTAEDVWTVIVLQMPKLFTLLLPAGLFLGIMLAYSRLHVNNEPLIMMASGLSHRYFLKINMSLAIVFAALVTVLSLWVNPGAQRYIDILMSASSHSPLQFIEEERFQKMPNYNMVVRVGDKVSTKSFKGSGIFAVQLDKSADAASCTVVARAAEKINAEDGADEYLSLIDGTRYCGSPGQKDYEILRFKRYNLRLPQPAPLPAGDESTRSFSYLWRNYHRSVQAAAELQWRCAQPISVILLVMAATALGVATPSRGRYAKFFPAITLYVLYVNFLLLSRAWLKKGVISVQMGLWWVHLAMLLCTIAFYWCSSLTSRR